MIAACVMLTQLVWVTPAIAQASLALHVRIYGQIVRVDQDKTTEMPVRFVLARKTGKQVLVLVRQNTVFSPRSPEAEISGFAAGDDAFVEARVFRRTVIAQRVQFDTGPFHPYPVVTFTGAVVRTRQQRSGYPAVIVRLESGAKRLVATNADTSYYQGTQPLDAQPALNTGDTIQVYGEHRGVRWLAVSIVLLPSPQNETP